MRYIFAMSLAGSMMLLFYWLTYNKKNQLFSYKFQDILLKGAIFYFLVPLVFLEPLYRDVLACLPVISLQEADGIYEEYYYYSVINGTPQFNTAYKYQVFLFMVWFLVALTILMVRICRYYWKRKQLLKDACLITEGTFFEQLERIRQELNIKRKIRLYDAHVTPFTMGVLHPVICLDGSMDMEQAKLALRHECKHIRRMDVLTRQLVSLAVIVHWFNPLVYLLRGKTEWVCEVCCDEATTKNCDKTEKVCYARMLIEHMELMPPTPVFYNALSKNAKLVEERITMIMKPKTRTKLQTAVAIVVLSVVFFMDSWTVLAYPRVTKIEMESSDTFNPDAEEFFVEDWAEGPFEVDYIYVYEEQFVDDEGNMYPVYNDGISTAALHFHQWVSGQTQKHELNGIGGCTVYIYSAKRCSGCGKVKKGDMISTFAYTVCPH